MLQPSVAWRIQIAPRLNQSPWTAPRSPWMYTVYSMARSTATASEVLTLRVPRDVARRLAREARRQRRTRGEVARAILTAGLAGPVDDPLAEAKRQSLLVRDRESERKVIRFVTDAADLKGWQ